MINKIIEKTSHPKYLFLKDKLKPKKHLGQNFLIDNMYLFMISNYIYKLCNTDTAVVEYGSGLGALTRELLKKKLTVHAVEYDKNLTTHLHRDFKREILNKNLFIYQDNAKNFNFKKLYKKNEDIVLCGNLPYNISNLLLKQLIDNDKYVKSAIFLLQKEVVDRIISSNNSKVYGILSVLIQSKFHAYKALNVPRESFWPIPRVDSSLLILSKLDNKTKKENFNWIFFKKIVKLAFLKRRKTIKNSMNSLPNIEKILKDLELNSKLRAENLTVKNFIDISKKYKNNILL